MIHSIRKEQLELAPHFRSIKIYVGKTRKISGLICHTGKLKEFIILAK
jgi:hypothetical protein